jgi:hypothetical protein
MRAILIASASLTLAASAAQAAGVYSNDFQTSSLTDISTTGVVVTGPDQASNYLQLVNGQIATLSLAGGFSSYSVSFDIYAINTLDGDGQAGGNSPALPDNFIVATNAGVTLEGFSFANFGGDVQSFPDPNSPAQTGATALGQLGFSAGSEATYHFTETFGPSSGPTKLIFTGNTNQDAGDEAFGLDNLVVTGVPNVTVGGVPEPASWALMLCGFGALGAALRRSRRAGPAAAL